MPHRCPRDVGLGIPIGWLRMSGMLRPSAIDRNLEGRSTTGWHFEGTGTPAQAGVSDLARPVATTDKEATNETTDPDRRQRTALLPRVEKNGHASGKSQHNVGFGRAETIISGLMTATGWQIHSVRRFLPARFAEGTWSSIHPKKDSGERR